MPDQYGNVRSERRELTASIVDPYLQAKKDRTVKQQFKRIRPGDDQRIRSVLSIGNVETTRLSSSESFVDPATTNLQNLAKKISFWPCIECSGYGCERCSAYGGVEPYYQVREVFISDPGYKLLAVDYSKAEAIAAAILSGDTEYYEMLTSGEIDVHKWNAAQFFDRPMDKITKAQRQVAKFIAYACVPLDTEILTMDGWKTYDEISEGEAVVGYDVDNHNLVPDTVKEVLTYEDAPLVHYHHKRFDAVCTPNHRWRQEKRVQRDNVAKWHEFTGPIDGKHNRHIILSAHYTGGKGLTVEDYNHVTPADVVKMTAEQRETFLLGVVTGEGYYQGGKPRVVQSSGPQAEAYRLAMFLDGNRVSSHPHSTSPNVENLLCCEPYAGTQTLCRDDHGRGPVWCPRTGTEHWVMRQRGNIYLTGNTAYMAGPEKIASTFNTDVEINGFKLTVDQVAELRRQYLDIHPLEDWWDRVDTKLKDQGYLTNLLGLKRWFLNPDPHKRLKEALSHQCQSSVATLINKALVEVDDQVDDGDTYQLLLQVHDEIMGQVREDSITETRQDIQRIMEQTFTWHEDEYHIPTEAEIGDSWGRLEEING